MVRQMAMSVKRKSMKRKELSGYGGGGGGLGGRLGERRQAILLNIPRGLSVVYCETLLLEWSLEDG